MQIDIPLEHLIAICGGSWGNSTAVNVGEIVMNYLYGSPTLGSDRKRVLGAFLVDVLERELKK